jgi:hypothetical protein
MNDAWWKGLEVSMVILVVRWVIVLLKKSEIKGLNRLDEPTSCTDGSLIRC